MFVFDNSRIRISCITLERPWFEVYNGSFISYLIVGPFIFSWKKRRG